METGELFPFVMVDLKTITGDGADQETQHRRKHLAYRNEFPRALHNLWTLSSYVSYGDLQSDGGYQIRQFRSEKPTGPYVDVAGNTLEDQDDHFNYGLKMMGNYTFPSLNYTYMAPGGQSTFQDDDGKYYITYHQRFDDGTEYHEPRVHQMYTNEDGWFVAAPFATMGETLSEKGYKKSDVSGTFYVVNHGTDISSKIREAEAYTFADGKVTGGEKSGTYEVKEGTDYITITLDGVVYKGVLMEMTDEAENPVFCFSAAGDNEETLGRTIYPKGVKKYGKVNDQQK